MREISCLLLAIESTHTLAPYRIAPLKVIASFYRPRRERSSERATTIPVYAKSFNLIVTPQTVARVQSGIHPTAAAITNQLHALATS